MSTPETPARGRNGLAIAGFIFAFLLAPLGFLLSVIGLIQASRRRQKGKGLAIAGIFVSLILITAFGAVMATVGKNITTLADPGCTKGKAVVTNSRADGSAGPAAFKTQLQADIDGLNAAAAEAKNDDVRAALKALADDYAQLLKAVNTATPPPASLEDKIKADATAIDELCTLGGAK